MTHNSNTNVDTTTIIYLKGTGNLSLSEIANLIHRGDQDCIDSLLETIYVTLNATDTDLHVQSVEKLASRCAAIGDLLAQMDSIHRKEVVLAFEKLDNYANFGIKQRLH